jgi:hypothetical protein
MLKARRRLAALGATAALVLALAGTGCGGEDDDSIPVITGPTGPTGFGDADGLEDSGKDKDKGN